MFTITCQSRGGPATLVRWTRTTEGNTVTIEENSTYSTSRIIVDTSSITVYNNTLTVRGREGGAYKCNVTNSQNSVGAVLQVSRK